MAEVIKMAGTVRSVNGIEPDENANVQLPTKVEPENVRYVTFLGTGIMQESDVFETEDGQCYYEITFYICTDLSFAKEIIKDKCKISYLGYGSSTDSTSFSLEPFGTTQAYSDKCVDVVEVNNSSSTFSGSSIIKYNRLWTFAQITSARYYRALITLAYVPIDETSES